MAVNETNQSAASRRFFFGTNVLLMIAFMVIITIGINWIGHAKNWRRDVAGGFGGTQLSERAKRILAKAGPNMRITSVYTSDEPENDRKKYAGKVQDLTQEIHQFNKSITVEHLYTGNEKAELRNRVEKKFGSAAVKYKEVIDEAEGMWTDLDQKLAPMRKELTDLLQSDSWLSAYPTMANIGATIKKDIDNVEQTRKEVDDLVKGEGLPQYQEANTKIKTFNDELKKHLDDTQKWMGETQKLAQVLADPKNDFIKTTRAKLAEMNAMLADLTKIAGDPKDQNVPQNPVPVLQEYAKAANKLSAWLVDESARVEAFVKANPMMQRNPRWLVKAQVGPFATEVGLNMLLAQEAQDISQASQALRQVLKENAPQDQLQNLIRQIRQLTVDANEQLGTWSSGVQALFEEASKIKPDSKEMKFLASGASGALFKPVLDKLEDITKKIAALPALKLDEIAKRLQQENIVVIESDKDVRVVTFDEMWPVADPQAFQYGGKDEEGQRRVFSGDGAISNAVLAMQVDKPFATVILVAYEPQANPQMRQFMRPPTPPIPLEQVTLLKEKLEGANFKVKDWNLATENAKKPDPEEGTQAVYVILPPAPKQQSNPFMQQPTEKSFGEAELKQVKDALGKDSAAIFLAVWEPPSQFGPPEEYTYGNYLQEEWGIEVKSEYRVIRGVVDRHDPGKYNVNLMAWQWMSLNGFTSQPVGDPLKSRRVLMLNVCPLAKAGKVPDGVKLEPILEVPATTNEVWADKDVMRIIKALRSPEGGSFSQVDGESLRPPFAVAMAGENEKNKSRVVVLGSGQSFIDEYLKQRPMHIEGKEASLKTDPPPTEDVDLFVNAIYWLSGHKDLIAAGPAQVPIVPPIAPASQKSLWLITFGWAFAVVIAGGAVMMARRK